MRLPAPRGPVSTALFARLLGEPGPMPSQLTELVDALPETTADARSDEDVQISLWTCYGFSYEGFDGIDARWEREPSRYWPCAAPWRPCSSGTSSPRCGCLRT